MTISPEQAERLADGLRVTFDNLESLILEIIMKRISKGINNSSWYDDKLADVFGLRNEISRLVQQYTDGMDDYVKELVTEAYTAGQYGASTDFTNAGRPIPSITTAVLTSTAPIPERRIATLVGEAVGAVDAMKTNILRKTDDEYRKVVASTVSGTISGVETRVQTVQRVINELADRGISGFTDRAGRKWSMGAYADMAVRTAVGRAAMAGHEDRLTELGEDLVIVSQHPDECPLCRPYEGKIFSISGKSDKYPPLQKAKDGGLFHPNCGHVATAYFEGYTSPMPAKMGTPTDYVQKQRQRAIERQIRKYKNRAAVAMSPQAKKDAEAKLKKWQATMRDFTQKTGRRRKPERERFNFGAAGAKAPFKTTPIPNTQVLINSKKVPPAVKPTPEPAKPATATVTATPEPAKPKRVRRTKAQIEADKATADKKEWSKLVELTRGIDYTTQEYKDYRKELIDRMDYATPAARKLLLTYYKPLMMNPRGNDTGHGDHYSRATRICSVTYTKDMESLIFTTVHGSRVMLKRRPGTTYFHEVGHAVDHAISIKQLNNSYNLASESNRALGRLRQALHDDTDNFIKDMTLKYGIKPEEIYSIAADGTDSVLYTIYKDAKYGGMTDIIEGSLYRKGIVSQVFWGHGDEYFRDRPNGEVTEAFAHFFESQFNNETRAVLESTFPTAYKIFLELLEEWAKNV
jgi:hypothetical protein